MSVLPVMKNLSTTTIKLAVTAPKNYIKFRYIQAFLVKITLPYIFIITCIGLFTNTSTIVLLSKSSVTKNLRHKWTLIALALSDLILNIALLIRVIHDLCGGKVQHLCILISFLSHLAELLSACFIVLFTIQRYAAVQYPLQAAIQKRSSPFIALLFIFLFSVSFCIALVRSNKYIHCHEELELKWFIADALSSFIIPFSLILIFNILIVNSIRKHARSLITVQSTMPRRSRHGKKDMPSKNNPFDETSSNEQSLTLQGTICDMDIDGKLNSNNSSIKKHKQGLTANMSNETSVPMLPIEKEGQDDVSITLTPSTSFQSLKTQSEAKQKVERHLSNDVDFISTTVPQTTQSIRVTRMLVLVSTCFLILNAPAHLCMIALKIYTTIDSPIHVEHVELENFKQAKNLTNHQIQNFVFIQEDVNHLSHDVEIIDDQILIHLFYILILVTQLISYASYSVNFFLYSFSGVAFRTSLKQWFSKLRLY